MVPQTTVAQAITAAYLRATRKATGLDITSTKGTQMLALLNFFSQDWANDTGTDWHSLRQTFTLPSVVTATDTFSFSTLTTLNHISRQEGDFIRIYHTDGVTESDYTIVDISMLYNDGPTLNSSGMTVANATGTCAISGTNIIFERAFLSSDPQFGGTIKLPGYKNATILTANTDIIQVDDVQWLTTRCAAEYVLNDVTRVAHYAPLKDEADQKYNDMRMANESQITQVYVGGWSPLGETF